MLGTSTKLLQFRHEMFRRDRPDLLPYIKKHAKSSPNESQEVATLKIQIQELRDELDNKTNEMEELRLLVEEMAQFSLKSNNSSGCGNRIEPSPTKRPRLTSRDEAELKPESTPSSAQYIPVISVSSSIVSLKSEEKDNTMHESYLKQPKDAFDNVLNDNEHPSTLLLNDFSGVSCFEDFPDFCDPIGELEAIYREQPCVTELLDGKEYGDVTTTMEYCASTSTTILTTPLVTKLTTALSTLPEHLQQTFVNRFVSIVSDSDAFAKQTDSIVSLADLIAKSNSTKFADARKGSTTTDENTMILAAAALENYIKSSSQNPTTTTATTSMQTN
jgi:hypothetical protein